MSQSVVALRGRGGTGRVHPPGFVHRDALDPTQTPLFRTPLQKGERICGLIFHVQGPRAPDQRGLVGG